MKRKLILSFISILLLASSNLFGFCVYNNTDVDIKAKQVSGGVIFKSFKKEITHYDGYNKACCNWKNHDCNKEGKRDSIVSFDIYRYSQDIYDHWKIICKDVKIKAGGYIVVEGKNGNYRCIPND